jgi:Zn-dependent membrane protease YugP
MFGGPLSLLILLVFGLSLLFSYRVKNTFRQWAATPIRSRMTGYEAARKMLDANGLHDVKIEAIAGELTDHYDPRDQVIRLSEPVYGQSTISAVSVACHEVGHAIQHKVSYPMLVARHSLFPVASFGSNFGPWIVIAGFLLSFNTFLIGIGIILFTGAVIFQLVTLPVEFNASSRARQLMLASGYITQDEDEGARKVLNAAALTYVAAALLAVLQLLNYILMFLGRRE